MITKAAFFGGTQNHEGVTGSFIVHPRAGRTVRMNASSTPIATLPDARTLWVDHPILVLWNVGAATITVHDNAGNSLGTVAQDEVKDLGLFDITTQAGVWHLVARTFL